MNSGSLVFVDFRKDNDGFAYVAVVRGLSSLLLRSLFT